MWRRYSVDHTFSSSGQTPGPSNERMQSKLFFLAQFCSCHSEQASSLPLTIQTREEIDRISLVGTGSSNQPTGIINQAGINSVQFGSGNGGAPTNYDQLLDALYEIQNAKGNQPSATIHHPRTARDYGKLKATDNQPLLKPEMLRSIPYLISQTLPVGGNVGSGTDLSSLLWVTSRNYLSE